MKFNDYIKTSVARQFGMLTGIIIITFCLLIGLVMVYQYKINYDFEKVNSELKKQKDLVVELEHAFDLAVSEVRAHFAFGELGQKTYLNNAEKQQNIVKEKMIELQKYDITKEDKQFLSQTEKFYAYYFEDMLPKSISLFEKGEKNEVIRMATTFDQGYNNIRNFQENLDKYIVQLDRNIEERYDHFSKKVFVSQIVFAIVFFLLIIGLIIFVRIMIKKLGVPLNKLTVAASAIADGKTIVFEDSSNRKDELGLFSKVFEKMTKTIQEKEHSLNAQNEELIAQQEELQAQQTELKQAIETMRKSELQLKRRNQLIHDISNSLDKRKVLASIVTSMSKVIEADKGLIVNIHKQKEYASFGLAKEGVQQFITYLNNGSIQRLLETKKPYTVKRKSHPVEQGYHEGESYSFDIYVPILSTSGNVVAAMIFTRYDNLFKDYELSEFEILAKQVAISLEKVNLFEQSEEDRLLTQDILNTINEGILLIDEQDKILQLNEKICYQLDCQEQDFIHQSFTKWIEHISNKVEDPSMLVNFFKQAVLNKNDEQNEFVFHQITPVKRVVQVYIEPLYRGEKKFGTVIVHRDITREYEVDVMKSEFVSTVSHELRTPLASVLGFTELMLNKELKPERQKKYLTTIYQEAKRLTSLINDFLDVQRMEVGKQTYDKKYDDVIPLIKSVIETQKIQAVNHHIHFKVLTKNTMVLGDKDKIAQVFNNLLSNSIKYSPDGGDVFVKVYEEDSFLKIDFRDEGLGIPEDAIAHLFTKFYRVDNTDRRRIGGTGLGLSIVKEIMKAHEGDITVTSELKKGSTFTISFPLVIGLASSHDTEQEKRTKEGKINVIIVEDDNSLANLLQTELEESNFNVKVFSNGQTALEAIKKERPGAIVLDIMLEKSGINGWEIIKELKGIKELSSIPIFISSALDEKEKGLALGANEYLVKPYQPSKLSKLILQTLLKKDWSGQILIPSIEKGQN